MAAIFQIRRGSGSVSLVDGELYVNKGIDSLQYAVGEREITLAKLDELNTGTLYLSGGISASGDITASNLYVTGNVKIDGNLFLGNQTTDTITATGEFTSHLIPNPTDTYNIGSDTKRWGRMFINSVSASAFTGSLYGMGDPTSFSTSVDLRLDRVEASASLYDNVMSGSNRLYVSPSGSDSNDGKDPSTPFRTIKAAVESLGSAVYTNTKRHTIFVGSGEYTEQNPIALPPGVAIVGDTLRTVRLTAANPTKDYFHCHDGNYFYGLRFLNLRNPSFSFSYPCSTANTTISGGSISAISVVHSMTGYTDGNNQDLGIIIEGPDASGSIATATANVAGGVITQINVVSGGTNYSATEKPHISIPAPIGQRPIIGTSPYIQNCSSITGPFTTDGTLLSLIPGNANYAVLPYNINDVRNQSNAVIGSGVIDEHGAGGGIRIDGNLVHPSSPLESFVADAFTQVNQGGPGHLVINKGYAQFVSCFTTFCTYGFKVVNGGFANISNSVIDFGAKGLVSKTYFPQTYNTGSSLETLTSTVVGAVIDQDGAGYTGSVATVTITGGGGSGATAEATVNANGSIDEIVILTPGSGYTSQPTLTIAAPTGINGITASAEASKAEISGIAAILFQLESGSRGVDVSSNMILSGSNYLVTNVATGSSANQRYVTVYPAPPSITTGNNVYFHQLSNISTGGLVMEYVGSGVTYNALPKFGGVPNRTKEIVEYAPGRVFYSTVDNIGNLKIGDFFAVNQLTGEVTIDANQFNLSGLSAIGPFKRNGVGVGVILNEVSNNTTLLNAQGITGEDTVPTQFAVKGYIDIRDGRLNNLETTSASLNIATSSLNTYTASLKTAIDVTGGNTRILGNLIVDGTQTSLNTTETFIEDKSITLASGSTTSGIADGAGLNIAGANVSMSWEDSNQRLYFNTNIAVLGSISSSTIIGLNGDSVNVYSTSVDSRLSNLQSKSASVDNSITNLNNVSSSLISKTGSYATTGSNSFIGDQSINGNLYLTGSLIPSGNFVYDLGSSTNGFGDVYLSSSTIYMNNNAIFGTTDVVPVNVGDYLQGGIVYYVDTVNGFSYIVNKDDIGEVSYSNFTRVAGANSSVLGGGIANTNAITASTGGQQNPAKLCSDFSGGGYTDWYLPSTRELALIASNTNLMAASLAGVRYVRYWSSTADANASKTYYAGDDNRDDQMYTGYGYGNGIMYSVPDNNTSVGYVKAVRRTSITSIIRTLSFPNFNFSGSINVEGTIDGIAIGAFTTQSNERLTDLESSSVNLNIVSSSLNLYTASANIWSGTIDTKFTTLENVTSSLNLITASFNTWTGSTYNTFSQSVDDRLDEIEYTASISVGAGLAAEFTKLNQVTQSLQLFTASANTRLNNLESTTASLNTSISEINSYTSSLKTAITISGTDVSIAGGLTVLGTTTIIDSTVVNIKDNIIQLNGAGSANAGLVVRDATGTTTSGSLLWDTTNDYWIAGPLGAESKLLRENGDNVVSSSLQVLGGTGIVSGSSQITFSGISSLPTLVSGSSQITYASISSIPGGIVSGSSQILDGSTIHSSSIGDYQFNSIGVGTAASTVAGEIRATNDITAFYSSDIRLKENIKPIENALSKVELISGNTYDWKAGYEEIHSHKGNDVGVIAQEIEEILPQIVTNRDNGYKAVQYEKIVPLLIEAIKELSAKVKELENK